MTSETTSPIKMCNSLLSEEWCERYSTTFSSFKDSINHILELIISHIKNFIKTLSTDEPLHQGLAYRETKDNLFYDFGFNMLLFMRSNIYTFLIFSILVLSLSYFLYYTLCDDNYASLYKAEEYMGFSIIFKVLISLFAYKIISVFHMLNYFSERSKIPTKFDFVFDNILNFFYVYRLNIFAIELLALILIASLLRRSKFCADKKGLDKFYSLFDFCTVLQTLVLLVSYLAVTSTEVAFLSASSPFGTLFCFLFLSFAVVFLTTLFNTKAVVTSPADNSKKQRIASQNLLDDPTSNFCVFIAGSNGNNVHAFQ